MPTISFSFKDLQRMLKKKISVKEISGLLEFCKAEMESYDEREDVMTVSLQDTNLPYLWSVEGIARLLKGILGIEKGLPEINLKKGGYVVNVDKSIKNIRPYLFALVAKNGKIDDYFLKQIIQLQEKICESYGRRRKTISIGIYSYKNIQFPVFYKAVDPASVSFVPLESTERLNLSQILQMHPKGREYAWILEGFEKYPIFMDSKNEVLSFPPIINSNFLGKVVEGDTDLFIEITGTDFETTRLANNIFAHALHDRGFDIYTVAVNYPERKVTCPDNGGDKIKITREQIEKLIGVETSEKEIKQNLEKARYCFEKGTVKIPSYRKDILHWVDVAEDFAIMHGYGKIKPLPLTSYTTGRTFEITGFANKLRELLVGLGYQEIYSPILNSKNTLSKKTLTDPKTIVEIENPMSEIYSALRNWLTPVMLEVFGKNKHVEYPQKIFEQGIVTVKDKGTADYEVLACATCHKSAGFTEIKQVLEAAFGYLGIAFAVQGTEHPSFISGRAGKIVIKNREVGIIGEISPEVLSNFEISYPVSSFEINLTELMKHQ